LKLLIGDELREFVKGFLANLDTDNPVFNNAQPASQVETLETGTFDWFKALRWCPRELLDLVNSKACRGACPFNSRASTSDVNCQEPSCSMTRSQWISASG
jgi:DNA mismatch repair protein MLH3